MTFNPHDPATWPLLLTVQQIAAIWQLSVARINALCCEGRFVPAPVEATHQGLVQRSKNRTPRRWRKADVLRAVEGCAPLRERQRRAS